MKSSRIVMAVAACAVLAPLALAGGKPKLKDSVKFAKTWEAAVAEAKLLNLPIVVHSHGFYCGPCWGMHASVLQNKDYIKFADKNTVEVISLSRLDEGIETKEHRAETYEVTENGEKKTYLVEFPGMTVDEMLALNRSKAARFNDTGGVPFTAVIDPWTEKEMQRWSGGTASGAIQDGVLAARKSLTKEHGEGVERKALRDCEDGFAEARAQSGKGEFAKAIEVLKKADGIAKGSQLLQERATAARDEVVAAATAALDAIETLKASDAAKAKSELSKLNAKLRGTGLEERAKALAAELAEAS
ncbi:MAG: hypothetical protein IPH13_10030 [Planctomycetes bacterium]|nr:hypothetical protein [Planctomycetota bacterium]MCC7169865.1 hypothetical protein [Planctomycetota bacterium]